MTLNNSTGLYDVPAHHLYGAQSAPRPVFSSTDFVDSPEPHKIKRGPGRPVKDAKDNAKWRAKREKKRMKKTMSAQGVKQTKTWTPVVQVTPASSTKGKKRHSTSAQDVPQIARTSKASTPAIKMTPATASTKSKKRKRDSEAQVSQRRISASFVSADMLQKIQSSVKAAREVFSSPPAAVQREVEPSPKKAKKDKAGRKSSDTVDFDLMAKETRRIAKKAKKERKARRRSTSNVPAPSRTTISSRPRKTPIPLPLNAFSHTGNVQAPSPTIISSPPRKTAVPLPLNAFSHAVNASKVKRIGSRDSRRLMAETPESQLPKTPANLPDSPIPFKLTAIKTKPSSKAHEAGDDSPPSSASSAPALETDTKLDGRASLTRSNLLKYTTTTQRLSDGPKRRPKPSGAASTAGSSTSAGTTPSIASLFLRVGKPYSRSGAEIDPFVRPEVTEKRRGETHEEASGDVFSRLFTAVQKAVNFSDEKEYLDEFTAWRTSAARARLPCLGLKASGCTATKEAILRLDRDEASTAPRPMATMERDEARVVDAARRVGVAEALLARSIDARVPVPLGGVEGQWTLFCPSYSWAHVDKHGYGQRTLSIFTLPHVQDGATHTARLSIPPRSMLYPLSPFAAPPHASFRSTVVKTPEGYKLEVVFLGGGYAVVRVDLGLLLSGKGEGGVMEFLGVREGGVVWGG